MKHTLHQRARAIRELLDEAAPIGVWKALFRLHTYRYSQHTVSRTDQNHLSGCKEGSLRRLA